MKKRGADGEGPPQVDREDAKRQCTDRTDCTISEEDVLTYAQSLSNSKLDALLVKMLKELYMRHGTLLGDNDLNEPAVYWTNYRDTLSLRLASGILNDPKGPSNFRKANAKRETTDVTVQPGFFDATRKGVS